MSVNEKDRQAPADEYKVTELNSGIGAMASEITAALRARGGVPTGLPLKRKDVDYTVVSVGDNKRTKLILHASGDWSRERNGIVNKLPQLDGDSDFDGMLAEYAVIVSAHEIASVLKFRVSADTMRTIADESLPINTRLGLYSQTVGPCVRDFVRQNRLPLLERLHGEVQQAYARIIPQ